VIELTDTTASEIAAAFVKDRIKAGSPAMGMVMTLVVVVDDENADEAMAAANAASREHPARVLGVILGDRRGSSHVHAQVGTGAGRTGETALIRLRGEVVKHADSVVLPLLLPDSPVAIWWAGNPPLDPAADSLGALAQRRITDAGAVTRGKQQAMRSLCATYAPGNTDLAWTRLTPWRALLAAALDQYQTTVTSASVTAERISPSADLMVTWLSQRLKVRVTRSNSSGPGITEVLLETKAGPIRITRLDGKLATISSPDRPDRPIALKRLEVPALLAEELRRLDEDDVYAAVATAFAKKRIRA
jgi:glucose-6-phosphate dehydrogenase assembly protein OpcA